MRRVTAFMLAAGALFLLLAGCGGGDDDADQPAAQTATTAEEGAMTEEGAEAGTVHVELMEWMVMPSESSVPAGEVTFMAMNTGTVEHDLVVLQTDLAPSELPMDGDQAEEVGLVDKTPTLEPEEQQELTLMLEPGPYVLICNVPEHYEAGMRIAFRAT